MLLKNLYNLLTNSSSLLHSDRSVYATGGPGEGGSGSDDDTDATTEEPDSDGGGPEDREDKEGLEAAKEAKKEEVDKLKKIKVLQTKTKELISDYEDHVIKISEYAQRIAYLQWLMEQIEGDTRQWFLGDEIDPDQKFDNVVGELARIEAFLNAGGGATDAPVNKAWTKKKEAIDLIKALIGRLEDQKKEQEKILLACLDETLEAEINSYAEQELPEEKQGKRDKLVAKARKAHENMRNNEDGKSIEEQLQERQKVIDFIKRFQGNGKVDQAKQEEEDKADISDKSTAALTKKMEDLKQRREEVMADAERVRKQARLIKARIQKRVIPRIQRAFGNNPDLLEDHMKQVADVIENLDKWDARLIPELTKPFERTDFDVKTHMNAAGELDEEAIAESNPSIEDFIAMASDPEVDERLRKRAAVMARDYMTETEHMMDTPKHLLAETIPDYKQEIERYMVALSEKPKEASGYKITWLALYDFKNMGEKVVEWAKRQYTRRSDKSLGDFGKTLFEDLPGPLKTAANEFDRLKEQSELDNVEVYKQSYSNKDAWQVTNIMHKTRHPDEMKACLFLLADLGRIRWDDPRLWSQLMYFGHGAVQFNVKDPEAEIGDQGKLHSKLQRIVGVIWDFDTFQTWNTTNESNYKSKMESHTDFCDKTAEMTGGLDRVMMQDLKKYKQAIKNGVTPKVDPQRFEKMIHYNIEFGKGAPEGKLYYLIQGIAWGLLPRDAASRFNSNHINAYPVIDIFGCEDQNKEKPSMQQIRRWARLDGDENKPGKAFHRWFYTDVLHRERVYQRVDKALTQGMGQDHDDATCWFGVMDANTAKQILTRGTQGFPMPKTGYQNASVGMLHYLDNLIENYDSMGEDPDKETSAYSQIIRFVNMFAMYDGITAGRAYKDRTDFYKWSGDNNKKPRAAGLYGASFGRGGDRTTQTNIDTIRKYLGVLEPEFFEILYASNKKSDEDIQKFCRRKIKEYGNEELFGRFGVPKNATELHEATGAFITEVMKTPQGKDRLREMRTKIRGDHDKFETKEAPSDFVTVQKKWDEDNAKPMPITALGGMPMQ